MSTPHEEFREYAWNYFALHAQQRLQAFEFFIMLATAMLAGFAALMQFGQGQKWVSVVGLGLSFLSFVFWKLDQRTRALVKNAETALSYLDAQHCLPDIEGAPHPLRIFARDDHFTSQTPTKRLPWEGYFSYTRCFRWVYFAFASVGLGIAGWSLATL